MFDMLRDDTQLFQALNRIEAWAHRGRLPVAIDATAALIGAQIQDRLMSSLPLSAQAVCQRQCRNAYALAILRFVNGVTDAEQKAQKALSVSTLADKLQLPRHFVDLRHDSTHGVLPALQVLRSAAHEVQFSLLS